MSRANLRAEKRTRSISMPGNRHAGPRKEFRKQSHSCEPCRSQSSLADRTVHLSVSLTVRLVLTPKVFPPRLAVKMLLICSANLCLGCFVAGTRIYRYRGKSDRLGSLTSGRSGSLLTEIGGPHSGFLNGVWGRCGP